MAILVLTTFNSKKSRILLQFQSHSISTFAAKNFQNNFFQPSNELCVNFKRNPQEEAVRRDEISAQTEYSGGATEGCGAPQGEANILGEGPYSWIQGQERLLHFQCQSKEGKLSQIPQVQQW